MKRISGTLAVAAALMMTTACSRTEKATSKPLTISDLSKRPRTTGSVEWKNYWNKTPLLYPEAAKQQKKEGRVTVKFTVDKDGYVVNPQIAHCTDTVFAAGALSYISKMPRWEPAEKYGNKIAMDLYQPFLYTLSFAGETVVTTVSADTSMLATETFASSMPSLYIQMLNGDAASRAKVKEIDQEIKRIRAAEREITAAQKQMATAQKQMAAITNKK
ncbi:MAG: energy transducer TonB [Bacteroidetes bacterium]|nr:energy transducer TonB [Bacteroidota bacterium]